MLSPILSRWALLAATALVAAGPLHAQSAVRGTVLDDTSGRPVVDARLELIRPPDGPVRVSFTDTAGAFGYTDLQPGQYLLRVGRLGYRETTIELQTNDTLRVVLRLSVEALTLEPVEVNADRLAIEVVRGVAGFQRRRARAVGGSFFSRAQIERAAPAGLHELLRQVPGLMVYSARGTGGYLLNARTHCPPSIYLDGSVIHRSDGRNPFNGNGDEGAVGAFEALSLVHPLDLDGVEVYMGPSQVPAEFGGSTASCGVVSLWTRRGEP